MRRIAIWGGGFGLYGHCQSILDRRWGEVVLERRLRDRLSARPELSHYLHDIEWVDTIAEALPAVTVCILALPPQEQVSAVGKCMQSRGRFSFGLEKPLSHNPESAKNLLLQLCQSGRHFRVNYSFMYLQWYPALVQHAGGPLHQLEICWTFRAHHHQMASASWKSRHSLGGGALRFYGIHLIAIAARLGYRNVQSAHMGGPGPDACEYWHAILTGPNVPALVLHVDENAEVRRFEVVAVSATGRQSVVSASDPFGCEVPAPQRDIRCTMLEAFHDDLDGEGNAADIEWHSSVLELWEAIEQSAVWRTRA